MSGIGPVQGGSGPGTARSHDLEKLRHASQELQGVFMSHLFQAMRETVPEGGLFEDTAGEGLFNAMFDATIASQAAGRMESGPAEELYRQLSARLAALRGDL